MTGDLAGREPERERLAPGRWIITARTDDGERVTAAEILAPVGGVRVDVEILRPDLLALRRGEAPRPHLAALLALALRLPPSRRSATP